MAQQICFAAAVVNQLAQAVVDKYQLINTVATPITGVLAVAATSWFVERKHGCWVQTQVLAGVCIGPIRHLTSRAQNPYQTLGKYTHQRGAKQEGFDADIHQAGDGSDSTVGVQGRQYKVTSE